MIKSQLKNLSQVRLMSAFFAILCGVINAQAAAYTVINTGDTGAGSLRSAIATANGTISDDTISFVIPSNNAGCNAEGVCTITLTGGELAINSASTAGKLVITNSTGASRLLISGNNMSRVFFTRTNSDLTLSGVTVANGNGTGTTDPIFDTFGGGILNASGILSITNSILRNNITGNNGGGIFNSNGNLIISNSTINNNMANYGGGIGNSIGDPENGVVSRVTIRNSTISNNTALESDAGGGIDNSDELNLINVTVTGNRAPETSAGEKGGGIWSDQPTGVANLLNTIVAGNTVGNVAAAPDFKGTISATSSYNLIGNNQLTLGITNGTNNNQVGTNAVPLNALLAPLGNYGGATQTHALLSGSPAVNNGTATDPPTTDQRGAARIGAPDIGAFELNNTPNGGIFVANLLNGNQNIGYNALITADNGAFTYSVTGGALPNGITLVSSFAPQATVALNGTPTQSGIFNFAITATDGVNSNVTNYRLQVFSPTAATVSVSGRILTAAGHGISKARIFVTDENENTQTAISNPFGFYRFDQIPAGQTCIFTVNRKGYDFNTQTLSVTGELTDLNFVALETK